MRTIKKMLIGAASMMIPVLAMGAWDSVSSDKGAAAGVLSQGDFDSTLTLLFYPQRECLPIMTITTEAPGVPEEKMSTVSMPLVMSVDGEVWASTKIARDVHDGTVRYSILNLPAKALVSLATGTNAQVQVGDVNETFDLTGSKEAIFQAVGKCLEMLPEVPIEKVPTFHKPRQYTIL